jgi:hypothetical protein
MKCDRALALLATGGRLGRWWARRHATRCARCAAEADRLDRIARELAVVEPLSAAQRALWTSASTDPRPAARSSRYRPALLVGAAAVVALALGLGQVIVTLWTKKPGRLVRDPGPMIARPDNHPQPASPATIRELDDLKSGLQSLSQELSQLRRRAELLDERKAAAALSQRLDRSVAFRGS